MLLAKVYLDHGEALEWDMFHYWHKDINDESITIRRLWNFFNRLPLDSITKQDIAEIPEEARVWNTNTYMLANIVDGINMLGWYTIAANTKNKPRPPKPYPRPKTQKEAPKKKAIWPGKTIVDKGVKNG